MDSDISDHDNRLFEDLQELIALEVKDILATADSEGYDRRDVVSALELALAAEINALRDGKPVEVAGPCRSLDAGLGHNAVSSPGQHR